ncbi:TetR family transcriptional regulator [Escherichia coli]|uniref:TetR family transcriptional regulator n=1 Tax=Escherichia coli TaxID=562 RepID=A0A376VKT0_ECOLX|nr:TetR family transcriptional regulator [Escherichia coli]
MNNPAMTIKGEQAKKQLIAAALAQFGEYGMNATTREIAAQAGQNIAAITYYFGSKEDLYPPAPSGLPILLASSSVRTPKRPNACSHNHSQIGLPSVN